jgi:hypothetical protein
MGEKPFFRSRRKMNFFLLLVKTSLSFVLLYILVRRNPFRRTYHILRPAG